MTLNSFSKQIKQENNDFLKNWRLKKKKGAYTQWFDPQLWPSIQIAVENHMNLTNVLHYLWTW